jgi:PIN domain nuclease of toxin-antitoxin system
VSPCVVSTCSTPTPYGDQFDRIITATAKLHRLVLVSKAGNIADARIVETLW